MALTAVSVSPNTAPMTPIAVVVASSAAATGFAFTCQFGGAVEIIAISGDADWFYSNVDGQTAAAASMVKVSAGQVMRFQISGGQTLNFYVKTATGSSNLICVQEV